MSPNYFLKTANKGDGVLSCGFTAESCIDLRVNGTESERLVDLGEK
jgi:hypothetical protein